MRALSVADYKKVIEDYNLTDDATTRGQSVPHLFEQAAQKHKDKIAVICAGTELTYGELNSRANQFARFLVSQGIQQGDLVGVALNRSLDLSTVLLAVLKAGAAYVPIDAGFPAERIKHALDQAKPKLVVVSPTTIGSLASWRGSCLDVEGDWKQTRDGGNMDLKIGPESLAYIIYTSGSTGQPKGVEITHEGLANTLLSMEKMMGCDETDRLLAITTIAFDLAVPDMYLPLLCGGAIVMAQQHESKDINTLYTLMRRHAITMMQGTPSTWQMLLDYGWPDDGYRLTKVICGGEALSRRLADRLLAICGDGAVWNMYGPTEATVWASGARLQPGEGVFIGKPLANYQLYVLDGDLAPVPLGETGELYIGGLGLARGYHNDPDLTRSRFLDNPFHGKRMYRTGDLARWFAPGRVSIVGRADSQVKVRGHRIELSDIESAIADCEEISECAVVSRDDRLVAYCRRRGLNENIVVRSALPDILRPWLATRLPAYMMPAFFVELDRFPISPNGKVDRKALPDPVISIQDPVAASPVTDLQRHLFEIWSCVLGHDHFGLNDNFFEIGGDSIRIIRVQAELEKLLGRSVFTPKLFEHYTINKLGTFLANMDKASNTRPEPTRFCHRVPRNEEDIAIVSMACRLPGDVTTPEEFWKLLVNGGDAITAVPEDRWDSNALYSADPSSPGKSYCREGGFITSVDSFDASFFGIAPREARALDPTQYLMLEVCWEGFERAGYTSEQLRGSQTGVYIGISNLGAHHGAAFDYTDLDGYGGTGTAGSTISGRVSYVLGLEGPTLTVDTACSASLVATHLACTALRQGECDMAVSGGVSLLLTPGLHIEFSRLRGMSRDGRCRAFSADAEGTGWADGVAAVVLKRLSDAQRDGDTIHAILRGSAVNHGGRSASLTTPSGPAQERLVRSALAAASLQPRDIDYVEAHGTATRLGDPIESVALAGVFGGSRHAAMEPLWVGSAKSNIGHTQAAAGLVGLLKVVLSLQHDTLPQTIHISHPIPTSHWQDANMALVQQNHPWRPRDDRPRRAGVSAFGIGGTNAHVIVEEAPKQAVVRPENIALLTGSPHLLPFGLSGNTVAALRQQAEKLQVHLSRNIENTDRVEDVAYSLALTRNHFRQRLVLMAQDQTELLKQLAVVPSNAIQTPDGYSGKPRLAMLFTGQGSQWPGMGKSLARQFPVFREVLEEIASLFKSTLEKPLLAVIWAEDGSDVATLLQRTDYAQAALFGLEVALWRLWESWGVHPEFVLGHSIGELAAAHVAGVMNLLDACRLVAARGRLMQAQPGVGKMASLEASAAEVNDTIELLGLGEKAGIASLNTPVQTVISGDIDAVEIISAHFSSQGRKTKPLPVSHAFHSHHTDRVLAEFLAVAKTVTFHPPTLAVVSGLTGKLAQVGQLQTATYWAEQARHPVRFSDGVRTLINQGINAFLEVGPRPVLCGMGAMCIVDERKPSSTVWLPSLVPRRDDIEVIQASLAQLHVRYLPIDWARYFAPLGCRRLDLPTYAFQRERFWTKRAGDGRVNATVYPHVDRDVNCIEIGAEHNRFAINWHQIAVELPPFNGVWGIITPLSGSTLAEEIKSGLSEAGIQSHDVSNLQEAQDLDGLLCLWPSKSDVLRQTREVATKALTQLQDAAGTGLAVPLVWVTCNAVGTGADDAVDGLGASTLWGLMRTARNEHSELRLRLIDLGKGDANVKALASGLMLETEDECAIRHGQVLVPRIERMMPPVQPDQRTNEELVRGDGAVLITGGTGGIGQSVAKWLVNRHGVRDLVLTSRRGMDAPGTTELVDELARFGAKVTVIAGDLADIQSITNIMAMFGKGRPLRGVVHTAALLDDGVLSALTTQRCDAVFKPKVDGAWHLHRLTREMDLDLFVLFSSISGITGTAGQANYAAANSFLDALAYLRRAENLPATSVAWGLWGGKGMGAKLSETGRHRYTQLGLRQLAPEDAFEILTHAVHEGNALTMAAAYDLDQLRSHYGSKDQKPSLLLSLLGSETGSRAKRPIHESSSGQDTLGERLRNTTPDEHAAIMLAMVQETVATTLGFTAPQGVNVLSPLQEIGVDSLTAILIRGQLAKLTGLTLSPRIVFDYPNLTSLSQSLLSRVREGWESSSHESMSDGSTTPSSVKSDSPLLNMTAIRQGCLDPELAFANSTAGSGSASPQAVFITGGTGFMGAYILHQLLELGINTYCLVRAVSAGQAAERLVNTLSAHGLWKSNYEPLLIPVVGDMGQPLFGLDREVFNQLADQVDAICHSGALVDWMRPLEDYVKPNIVSTHETLRLASLGRPKAVHHISTVSTLPKYFGHELPEGAREYGYGTSKWTAEQMVAAARWRGATASVYRLPFVTASASTGHFRQDRGDFLHNLIAGSIQLGWFPRLDADVSAVLPVDYLASTIVTIMTQDLDRIGHDYDFLNATAPSVNDFFGFLGASNTDNDLLPFTEWRRRALAYAAAHPTSPLARIAAVIDELTEDTATAMFKPSPTGKHVFGGEIYPVPLVGAEFAQKYRKRITTSIG